MKKNFILLSTLMLLFGVPILAQEKGQIKVEITKEVDGKPQTFLRVYDSEKSLQADEELQQFMGEDKQLSLWFRNSDGFSSNFDSLSEERSNFYFHFNGDRQNSHNFSFFNSGDSAIAKDSTSQLTDHLKKLEVKVGTNMEDFHDQIQLHFDQDGQFNYAISDSLGEAIILKLDHTSKGDKVHKQFEVVIKKRLKITEDTNDFGKKSTVNTKKLLELENLTFFPNPAPDGRFRLRFDLPDEGELSINVYNLDGKAVFNRYFERYSGQYSDMIDLSNQSRGIYLLEIELEGKRLTRKIAID